MFMSYVSLQVPKLEVQIRMTRFITRQHATEPISKTTSSSCTRQQLGVLSVDERRDFNL
jgi:hypothetical protein